MLSVKDMTDLLYIHAACDKLNITLLGTEQMVGYHGGGFRCIEPDSWHH